MVITSASQALNESSILFICSIKNKRRLINMEILKIENRIALLSNRDPVGNMRIINKLKRQLRKLQK